MSPKVHDPDFVQHGFQDINESAMVGVWEILGAAIIGIEGHEEAVCKVVTVVFRAVVFAPFERFDRVDFGGERGEGIFDTFHIIGGSVVLEFKEHRVPQFFTVRFIGATPVVDDEYFI